MSRSFLPFIHGLIASGAGTCLAIFLNSVAVSSMHLSSKGPFPWLFCCSLDFTDPGWPDRAPGLTLTMAPREDKSCVEVTLQVSWQPVHFNQAGMLAQYWQHWTFLSLFAFQSWLCVYVFSQAVYSWTFNFKGLFIKWCRYSHFT